MVLSQLELLLVITLSSFLITARKMGMHFLVEFIGRSVEVRLCGWCFKDICGNQPLPVFKDSHGFDSDKI